MNPYSTISLDYNHHPPNTVDRALINQNGLGKGSAGDARAKESGGISLSQRLELLKENERKIKKRLQMISAKYQISEENSREASAERSKISRNENIFQTDTQIIPKQSETGSKYSQPFLQYENNKRKVQMAHCQKKSDIEESSQEYILSCKPAHPPHQQPNNTNLNQKQPIKITPEISSPSFACLTLPTNTVSGFERHAKFASMFLDKLSRQAVDKPSECKQHTHQSAVECTPVKKQTRWADSEEKVKSPCSGGITDNHLRKDSHYASQIGQSLDKREYTFQKDHLNRSSSRKDPDASASIQKDYPPSPGPSRNDIRAQLSFKFGPMVPSQKRFSRQNDNAVATLGASRTYTSSTDRKSTMTMTADFLSRLHNPLLSRYMGKIEPSTSLSNWNASVLSNSRVHTSNSNQNTKITPQKNFTSFNKSSWAKTPSRKMNRTTTGSFSRNSSQTKDPYYSLSRPQKK